MTEIYRTLAKADVDQAPFRRIAAVQEVFEAPCKASMQHIAQHAVRVLADRLIDDRLVTFDKVKMKDKYGFKVKVTLGVVAPHDLQTMQQRVEQHQEALARDVIAEACRQIENWGSYYSDVFISKENATRFVRKALDAVLRQRSDGVGVRS